jgi:hypothetical protein
MSDHKANQPIKQVSNLAVADHQATGIMVRSQRKKACIKVRDNKKRLSFDNPQLTKIITKQFLESQFS